MKFSFYLIALFVPLSLFGAPKYPFPQNTKYPYGILPSTGVNASNIQKTYADFMKRFYEESNDLARIKWDNPSQTVSEGIAYGMLITVYMDNATNNTQTKFNKLWKYYNKFTNNHKLMHWKINGFVNVAENNAATDAELDVAVALMQAYKQWGDESYLNDAKVLIKKIWDYEVNSNKYLKPGDSWDEKKNPSYFSTAALELFKSGGSQDWGQVIFKSYDLLKKVANSNTGLVPDWCTENGNALGNYQYDAARTPWRIAWGYVWYGHNDAKAFCSKIATWVNSKTEGNPSAVVDGYTLDGEKLSRWINSTFLGAFACAGMVDASHQTWLDKAYAKMETMVEVEESYYNASLKVIYLLLLSGNMPNFWGLVPIQNKYTPANATSFSPTLTSVSTSGTLMYSLPKSGNVKITVYTTAGSKVATLVNSYVTAGTSSVTINNALSNGAYWIELTTISGKIVQKLTINR